MNFDFSDDQRRLQEEVRRVLADHSSSAAVRTVLEGEALLDAGTWGALAGIGALGVAIPEAQGGAGMSHLETCLIAEECGRALVAAPTFSTLYLAAETLRHCGHETAQAKWLPRVAGGEAIITMALSTDGHALPVTPLQMEHGRISATLNAVPDAMAAQALLLLANDALMLVDLTASGVTRRAQSSLDPTRPLGQILLDQAPSQTIMADGAAASVEVVRNGAAVLLAFEQIGGAEAALHAARDYVMQRRAFGRIVGGFQAVKHKLADIYTAIELARAHAWYGAWALASGAPELPRAAAAARVAATQAYTLAAEEGLHLHGGIGYTWELDCHLHLRRARWLGQIIGNRHEWTERLAATLIAEAA
jgi:acyl-CoA dehydrogenase